MLPRMLAFAGLLYAGAAEPTLPELLRLHQAQPGDPDICERIGVAYLQQTDFARAGEYFGRALKLNPGLVAARRNLATSFWFLGEKKAAEQEFQTVLKSRPADPVAHLYIGLAEYERRDYRTAVTDFEKAGALASDNPEVRPVVVEALLGAAEAWDRAGSPQQALAAYRKAVALDAASESAWLAFAAFSSAHGNDRYGLQIVDQALRAIPGSPRLVFQRGVLSALDGHSDEAERSFQDASRIDPKWILPRLAMGVMRLEHGQPAGAAAILRAAIAADPRNARAHYLYATALRRTGDADRQSEALAELQRAIALDPADARSRTLLAQIYIEAGSLPDAIQQLEQARRSDPRNSSTLYQLGIAYRKAGRTESAARAMAEFRAAKAKAQERDNQLVQILRLSR